MRRGRSSSRRQRTRSSSRARQESRNIQVDARARQMENINVDKTWNELRFILSETKKNSPVLFQELLGSNGIDTDDCIFRIFQFNGYNKKDTLQWVEEITERMTEYNWNTLVMFLRTIPDYSNVQTYEDILDALSEQPSLSFLYSIVDSKLFYINQYVLPHVEDQDRTCCSILICTQPVVFSLNSMHYCKYHQGLALIYGLRHKCRTCRIFSLLAIKETGQDWNHTWFNFMCMTIPLRNRQKTETYNVAIRRHCSYSFHKDIHSAWYYDDDTEIGHVEFQYFDDIEEEYFSVPKKTWVYIDIDKIQRDRSVAAWIQAEIQHEGEWLAVDEKPLLMQILRKAPWVVVEDRRWLHPCRTYF